jgi:hypothetical protein
MIRCLIAGFAIAPCIRVSKLAVVVSSSLDPMDRLSAPKVSRYGIVLAARSCIKKLLLSDWSDF